MSHLLSGSTTPSANTFEIRLNNNHVVLQGSKTEAPSVLLKGSVVLHVREPIRVQAVRIFLTCNLRVAYTPGTRLIKYERQTLRQQFLLFSASSKHDSSFVPGVQEWPFGFMFQGGWSESLEGPPQSWIIYRLKAIAERPGVLFAKNYVHREHLRVIRTVRPESSEVLQDMLVENVWPDKIKYTFSTPHKGVMYGSTLPCTFVLIPLLKGLRIGKIQTQLWEERKYTLPHEFTRTLDPTDPGEWNEPPRNVCEDSWELPGDMETVDVDGYEAFKFSRPFSLPRNMKQCTQSLDDHGLIKIEHHLKFIVALHNPAGHTSELRCKLPIRICMPSMTLLNEANEMVGRVQDSNQISALENAPPPNYDEHRYDHIYTDLDTYFLNTPTNSAPTTPANISRSASASNLTSMDGNADGQFSSALRSGLDRLSMTPIIRRRNQNSGELNPPSERSEQHREPPRRAVGDSTSEGIDWFLRRQGQQAGPSTNNNDDLNRVPSYRTAMHTSTTTPSSTGLPSYETATSRPPSPQNPVVQGSSSPSGAQSSGAGTLSRYVHFTPDGQGGGE